MHLPHKLCVCPHAAARDGDALPLGYALAQGYVLGQQRVGVAAPALSFMPYASCCPILDALRLMFVLLPTLKYRSLTHARTHARTHTHTHTHKDVER